MDNDPTAPLPDEELAAIEAEHYEGDPAPGDHGPSCPADWQSWPCDASRLLVALRAERAARERVEAAARLCDAAWSMGARRRYAAMDTAITALRAALAPATGEGAEQ